MAPASAAVPSIRESLQAFNGMHSAADVPATLGAWQDSVKRWYQEAFSGGSVHAERDQIRPAARRPNTSDMVSMPGSPQVSRRDLPARGGSQRRAASCNGPRAKGEPPDSRRAPSPKAGPDPRSTMRMRSAGMGMSPSMSKRDITPSTSAGASAQGRSFPDDLPSTEASMPSATRANGSYAVDMEDLLDQHVAYYLRTHPEARGRHAVSRKQPGVYLLDGREVEVEWQHAPEPGGQGFLVVVDGPLRQPFSDYMEDTEANATYEDRDIKAAALHTIPKEHRISFNDQHKVYSRLEAMKVAKEQAIVRERAAVCVKDGVDVPGDIMAKYRKTINQKLGIRAPQRPASPPRGAEGEPRAAAAPAAHQPELAAAPPQRPPRPAPRPDPGPPHPERAEPPGGAEAPPPQAPPRAPQQARAHGPPQAQAHSRPQAPQVPQAPWPSYSPTAPLPNPPPALPSPPPLGGLQPPPGRARGAGHAGSYAPPPGHPWGPAFGPAPAAGSSALAASQHHQGFPGSHAQPGGHAQPHGHMPGSGQWPNAFAPAHLDRWDPPAGNFCAGLSPPPPLLAGLSWQPGRQSPGFAPSPAFPAPHAAALPSRFYD